MQHHCQQCGMVVNNGKITCVLANLSICNQTFNFGKSDHQCCSPTGMHKWELIRIQPTNASLDFGRSIWAPIMQSGSSWTLSFRQWFNGYWYRPTLESNKKKE
eukprot:UN11914